MKFGCSIGIFLKSAKLICRSTDISNCFRGSLRLRDNESQLYLAERQNGNDVVASLEMVSIYLNCNAAQKEITSQTDKYLLIYAFLKTN